jgi:2-methylcitrate dehydratase PrpD
MQTHIQRLARFVSDLRYEDIPDLTLRAAKCQVLDMAAAALASARSAEVQSLLKAAGSTSHHGGRSTVLATGKKLPPGEATLQNAISSIAFDFDDIIWMGHTCHSAVFAPLAVAEHENRSSRDFLTAVVAANEVGGRIGASCIFGPLNGQMWTFIHLAGAAAATCRLLGLDAGQTTHALAIALSQPNFPLQPGFLKPTSKLLAAGLPASAGIAAAYMARGGMTGEPTILEAPGGFWSRFSFLPLPAMLEGLGTSWVTDTLTVKTFPGCHYFQTALAVISGMLKRRGRFNPSDVRSIRIETTKLGMEVSRLAADCAGTSGEITPVGVAFDMSLAAAVMLETGGLDTACLSNAWLSTNKARLREWASLVKVEHDPLLTAKVVQCARGIPQGEKAIKSLKLKDLATLASRYRRDYGGTLFQPADVLRSLKGLLRGTDTDNGPAATPGGPPPLMFPNRVTIRFKNGDTETGRIDLPPGSLAAPGMETELRTKFMREAERTIGPEKAAAVYDLGLKLEQIPLKEFVEKVVSGVNGGELPRTLSEPTLK